MDLIEFEGRKEEERIADTNCIIYCIHVTIVDFKPRKILKYTFFRRIEIYFNTIKLIYHMFIFHFLLLLFIHLSSNILLFIIDIC